MYCSLTAKGGPTLTVVLRSTSRPVKKQRSRNKKAAAVALMFATLCGVRGLCGDVISSHTSHCLQIDPSDWMFAVFLLLTVAFPRRIFLHDTNAVNTYDVNLHSLPSCRLGLFPCWTCASAITDIPSTRTKIWRTLEPTPASVTFPDAPLACLGNPTRPPVLTAPQIRRANNSNTYKEKLLTRRLAEAAATRKVPRPKRLLCCPCCRCCPKFHLFSRLKCFDVFPCFPCCSVSFGLVSHTSRNPVPERCEFRKPL